MDIVFSPRIAAACARSQSVHSHWLCVPGTSVGLWNERPLLLRRLGYGSPKHCSFFDSVRESFRNCWTFCWKARGHWSWRNKEKCQMICPQDCGAGAITFVTTGHPAKVWLVFEQQWLPTVYKDLPWVLWDSWRWQALSLGLYCLYT